MNARIGEARSWQENSALRGSIVASDDSGPREKCRQKRDFCAVNPREGQIDGPHICPELNVPVPEGKQANAQANQKSQSAASAQQADIKNNYLKAFQVCMEGKGYTIK